MFLNKEELPFFPIIKNTGRRDYAPLNLSEENTDISIDIQKDPQSMHNKLQEFLNRQNASVAYGGYLERRVLYDRSDHFGSTEKKRNIHLGTDFWCEQGSVISCPLNGIIHGFKNNDHLGDYGPTILLKHNEKGKEFYTLYGHLTTDSIQNLTIGTVVSKGEDLAQIGNIEENGNYAPHLHFQVILDLGTHSGDYPGVSSLEDLEFFRNILIDPKLILGLR